VEEETMEMMTTDEGRHDRYVVTVQSPPRIVIADDEPDVLKLVSVALRVFGFDVVQAPDGIALLAEALGAPNAGRAKRRADVVVADVRMPGLSGLDVLALLRQDRLRTPMVLMSAYADGDTRACASALGADAFFAKPFDVDELVTTVLNLTPPPVGSRGE
jgi:two-component system response regulator AtoC